VRTVVVGIGNDFRGDDGAGLVAARLLRKLSLPDTEVIELDGEITRLLDSMQECESAILIDAVQSQMPPGYVHRFDASKDSLPDSSTSRSTHGISVSSIIELAKAQGIAPRTVLVFGIVGSSFEHSHSLTPEVTAATERVVQLVSRELLAK
jgi:hydrogenase maturation protease